MGAVWVLRLGEFAAGFHVKSEESEGGGHPQWMVHDTTTYHYKIYACHSIILDVTLSLSLSLSPSVPLSLSFFIHAPIAF